MNLSEYQYYVARTINKDLTDREKELHALHLLSGEVGEVHSLYQKVYQGHPFSEDDLKKEIGDVLWGLAELCTARGYSLGEVAQMNIDKLKKRYPDGFDAEHSLHRSE